MSNPDYYLGKVHAQHKTIVIIMSTVEYTDVLYYIEVAVDKSL